ncbi:MAG: hypothetical protein ACREV3_12715 [Gammaproteobacteria bacterium]
MKQLARKLTFQILLCGSRHTMQQTVDGSSSFEILRLLTEGTAAATGEQFFRSLARHAAQALHARYAFVAETLNAMESRSLAYWEGSRIARSSRSAGG